MAEEDSAADTPDVEEGDEGGEEAAPPQQDASDEGEGEDSAEEAEDAEAGAEAKADEDNPEKTPIPVRSTAVAQNVIARQKRTIEKLRGKQGGEAAEAGAEGGESEDAGEEEGDGELSTAAQRAIERGISRAVAPLAKALASSADERELSTFLTAVPEAKKYEKRIRAFMAHEAYAKVPPELIFHHLAFPNAQKIGANKRSNADRAAAVTRAGGRAPRKSAAANIQADTIAKMSEKEFSKLQQEVLTGTH